MKTGFSIFHVRLSILQDRSIRSDIPPEAFFVLSVFSYCICHPPVPTVCLALPLPSKSNEKIIFERKKLGQKNQYDLICRSKKKAMMLRPPLNLFRPSARAQSQFFLRRFFPLSPSLPSTIKRERGRIFSLPNFPPVIPRFPSPSSLSRSPAQFKIF